MGCGASTSSVPPKEDEMKAESEVGTWATKTSAPSTKDALNTEVETFSAPKGGSVVSNRQAQAAVMVLDADEDDDGIEIIYETQPKFQAPRQPAAANGQEPPDAEPEEPRRPEPKPLPKQQQEEAAKLAETRKRFDNHRYQNQQKPSGSSPEPFEIPGAEFPNQPAETLASTKGYPGPQSAPPAREDSFPKGSSPKTDMMFGLNVTDTATKDSGDPFACLPGGIFDDLEDVQQAPMETKNREQQHYKVEKNGFDDDDEMLMREIMENFDA